MSETPSINKIIDSLPVFRIQWQKLCVLYTPGKIAVVDTLDADHIQKYFNKSGHGSTDKSVRQIAEWLKSHALKTVERYSQWLDSPFQPECLTVYLSNYCNLACTYCYASNGRQNRQKCGTHHAFPVIDEKIFYACAKQVAVNCAAKGIPFHLVLHGGGEPTLHFDLVRRFVTVSRQIAKNYGIGWFGYIATNGVLSEKNAAWIARHFDRIGLSCDGPPDIQNQQRPMNNGSKSASFIEQTASVIAQYGKKIEIRTTITPQTMSRQKEIVSYLYETLGASTIRFEPAYRVTEKNRNYFIPHQADPFAKNFLSAQKTAHDLGCELLFSGVRLSEIHGPYCNVLRNVLLLTPNGHAVNCFMDIAPSLNENNHIIGSIDQQTGSFVLNNQVIKKLRLAAIQIPEMCRACINMFHCARGCPDWCQLDESPVSKKNMDASCNNETIHFRCRLNKLLAYLWIQHQARKLVNHRKISIQIDSEKMNLDGEKNLLNFLADSQENMDKNLILKQWNAVKQHYRINDRCMPEPLWVKRGFEHDGRTAWNHICRQITCRSRQSPLAIYIHIPFCLQRCGFCDCYAIPLGKQNHLRQKRYFSTLMSEISSWGRLANLRNRPVSTIHFGGGTPNCIDPLLFEQLVDKCRNVFGILPETEWALESTGLLLSENHLKWLKNIGFTRLHIGVQTLEEPLRHQIGRKTPTILLMKQLSHALKMKFITSVDIVYGLPNQTSKGLLQTLDQLTDAGIHGISLYRFNISRRNRWFVKSCQGFTPEKVYDYCLLQAADQVLVRRGYKKNYFNHYALPKDRNIYFTHAQRGEDLLAMGTIADGIFGDYCYRHPGYAKFLASTTKSMPALEGGLCFTKKERTIHPQTMQLMGGYFPFKYINGEKLRRLVSKWVDCALIKESAGNNGLDLTANGSWFISDMIREMEDINIPELRRNFWKSP